MLGSIGKDDIWRKAWAGLNGIFQSSCSVTLVFSLDYL